MCCLNCIVLYCENDTMLNLIVIFSLIASASVWISLICPSCLGRGNVFGMMFCSMQSLHDNIIPWLSFP